MANIQIPSMVMISTQRLLLREFNLGDGAAVFAYGSLPEVTRYVGWGPYMTMEQVEQVLERFTRWQFETPRLKLVLAITLNGRVIGDIGLSTRNEAIGEAELGYALHPDSWGQGYGSEAAAAMLEYGFRVANWERIFATCYVENEPSAALLRKIGMHQEAVLHKHPYGQDRPHDSFLFAISRPEWEIQDDEKRRGLGSIKV